MPRPVHQAMGSSPYCQTTIKEINVFVKRSNATSEDAQVSRNLVKCASCGKPVMTDMIKLGSLDSEIECLCSECQKPHADPESK